MEVYISSYEKSFSKHGTINKTSPVYESPDYWDNRYIKSEHIYDWYYSWRALKTHFEKIEVTSTQENGESKMFSDVKGKLQILNSGSGNGIINE